MEVDEKNLMWEQQSKKKYADYWEVEGKNQSPQIKYKQEERSSDEKWTGARNACSSIIMEITNLQGS